MEAKEELRQDRIKAIVERRKALDSKRARLMRAHLEEVYSDAEYLTLRKEIDAEDELHVAKRREIEAEATPLVWQYPDPSDDEWDYEVSKQKAADYLTFEQWLPEAAAFGINLEVYKSGRVDILSRL